MAVAVLEMNIPSSAVQRGCIRVLPVTGREAEPAAPVTRTGRIEAEDEVVLGFRIDGQVMQNDLNLGEQLKPRQILAPRAAE